VLIICPLHPRLDWEARGEAWLALRSLERPASDGAPERAIPGGLPNPACFDTTLLEELRQRGLSGCTLGEALSVDIGRPPALVRSAVFHLLWNHYLTVDVTKPLTRSSILTKGLQS
jgi:hypothetical protein